MQLHPERNAFVERCLAVSRQHETAFAAELYRFIDPRFSRAADIVSGAGARQASGRWHLKGASRVSYTAMEPETALAEALATPRYYNLPLSTALPRVLVSLRLKAGRVLDLRAAATAAALQLPVQEALASDWRSENEGQQETAAQAWGAAFQQTGLEAIVAPSAARDGGGNVIVFPAALSRGSQFRVTSEVSWPK
jgi:RES domain-containing protein